MNLCQALAAKDRDWEHRLEFKDDTSGIITWLCLDCGETVQQYSDNQGV